MINLYNINNTDFTKNGNATLEALRCEFRVEVNGAWSIELEIPYDSFGKWKLVQKDTMLKVDVDCIREFTSTSQLFRVDNYRKTETSLVVIAYSVGMEARHDVLIKNLTLKNKTASEVLTAFAQYIDNNKYTLYTDLSTTGTISLSNSNLISAISYDNEGSFTKVFGGEIVYDNKTIKILNRIGNSTPGSHPVIYGKNMTGISYQEDSSGMVTRIYPISTDGVALLTQDNKDYVDSDYAQIYPYLRKRYMTTPYQLIDDVENPITPTQVTTRAALDAVKNKAKQLSVTAMKHAVSCLGDNIPYGAIKKYKSEVIEAVCDMATTHCLHATLDSKMEKYIKDGMNDKTGGMFSVPEPEYSWHGDYEDGWWYGDDSAAWATDKAYARNEYKYISKKWSYFDNDGKWEMPKDDNGDWDWWQPQDGLSDKFKYGNFDRYYAKDEWIYITVSGTLTAYWIDGDGYYDDSYTEASTWTWHGTGLEGDPYWFGASDAAGDPDKYAHDQWVFIDGTLYYFDNEGYYDGRTKMEDYQWDWVESGNKHWFGNNEDKTFASIYLQSQWAKIDSDYYYFDQDGYAIDEEEMIIMIIQSFLTSMASLLTEVDTQKAALYAKLYEQMEDWGEKQFSVEHIDLPAVTISVNMIDLQKTQEYKDYAQLEKICLGDAVDCQNPKLQIYSQERVIGLTYDCIRGYNTSVTIGHTEASLGSVLSNSSGSSVPSGFDTSAMESAINTNSNAIAALQSGKQDKLTAGDNITIVNNVISATGGGGHGLEYWTETSETISRTTNETIYDFSCDAQFLVENGVDITYTSQYYSPRKYTSSGKAVGALGHYYDGDSNPENGFVLFSTDPDAVKVLAELNGLNPQRNEAVAISYNGHTIYTNGQIYNATTNTTIAETSGLIDVGTFDSYSEFVNFVLNNSGLEIHTNLLKQTGIGVGDKVVWGGNRYSASDEYPFYATDDGLVYGKKHISKGIHESISGDEGTVKVGQEIGNYVGGDGWTRCLVFRMKNTTAPYIMGIGEQSWDTMQIVIATTNQADLDFEWGYSNNTLTEPYGVEEWLDKDEYTGGYDTASVTYNGKTWYCLQIHPARKYNFSCSISGISKVFSAAYNDDAATNGLKLLQACHAVDHIEVVTEIGTENYAFKYGGDYTDITYIDTDGNALFKEITTDAGSLTSQMARKQNLLTAGENIQINGDTISATDTTYEEFDGGGAGLVPAVETQSGKFLKDNGTWDDAGGGTEVEANPSGSATATLNKIAIDNVIYSLPSGGGGGGGASGSVTTLFENDGTTSPASIILADDLTNYDVVLFQLGVTGGDAIFTMTYNVDDLAVGDTIGAGSVTNIFVWYYYTNSTTLTLRVSAGNVYMSTIVGIKFGEGGGDDSSIPLFDGTWKNQNICEVTPYLGTITDGKLVFNGENAGIVVTDVSGISDANSYKLICEVSASANTSIQAGRCSTSANLVNIINYGTGRLSYTNDTISGDWNIELVSVNITDGVFFGGGYLASNINYSISKISLVKNKTKTYN